MVYNRIEIIWKTISDAAMQGFLKECLRWFSEGATEASQREAAHGRAEQEGDRS